MLKKKREDSGTLELEIQVKTCIGSEKDNHISGDNRTQEASGEGHTPGHRALQ